MAIQVVNQESGQKGQSSMPFSLDRNMNTTMDEMEAGRNK